MRENLEEMNARGLARILCCWAAPPSPARTSSATCVRLYQGRLFYGRTPSRAPHHGPAGGAQSARRGHPDFGRARAVGSASRRLGSRRIRLPPPSSPAVAATTRLRAPSSGPGRQGDGPGRRPRVPETRRPVRNQWGFRPDKVRATRRSSPGAGRAQDPAGCGPRGERPTSPGRLRILAASGDGNELIVWETAPVIASCPLRLPPPEGGAPPLHRRLLPPGESGELDYVAFHIVTIGDEVTEEALRLKPRTATRTTSSSTA